MAGPHQTDAARRGAGPTGLVAALSFAEAGLTVELIERNGARRAQLRAPLHPRSLGVSRSSASGRARSRRARARVVHDLPGEERRATLRCMVREALPLPARAARERPRPALPSRSRRRNEGRWSRRRAGLAAHGDAVAPRVERLERSRAAAVARTRWAVGEARTSAPGSWSAPTSTVCWCAGRSDPFEEPGRPRPSRSSSAPPPAPRGDAARGRPALSDALRPLPGGRAAGASGPRRRR